jgi:protein SMG6
MELRPGLDGLCSNTSQLGETAQEAVAYITCHIRLHNLRSLKVLTSKGNYLTSLNVRTEQVTLSDEGPWEWCKDDLILKAAIWQDEHWVD